MKNIKIKNLTSVGVTPSFLAKRSIAKVKRKKATKNATKNVAQSGLLAVSEQIRINQTIGTVYAKRSNIKRLIFASKALRYLEDIEKISIERYKYDHKRLNSIFYSSMSNEQLFSSAGLSNQVNRYYLDMIGHIKSHIKQEEQARSNLAVEQGTK